SGPSPRGGEAGARADAKGPEASGESRGGWIGRAVWDLTLNRYRVLPRCPSGEAGAGARAAGTFSDSAPRQLEDERRPFTRRADDLQIAAHPPSEIAADREAQAGAVRAAGERS